VLSEILRGSGVMVLTLCSDSARSSSDMKSLYALCSRRAMIRSKRRDVSSSYVDDFVSE
jgi:hypothetical protein